MPLMVDWTLSIDTMLQILTLAAFAVMGWMKLKIVERDLNELKREVVDFRELKSSLLVLDHRITAIYELLKKREEA